MSSLSRTIHEGLTNIGHGPRDLLLETLADFETLGLGDEERVSALATVITASAASHHQRHVRRFLDAVQVWALETAADHAAGLPRIGAEPEPSAAARGAELLILGLAELIEALDVGCVPVQDRVVAELTLYTRLLGVHDAHTILLVLGAVAAALADPEYRPGQLLLVSLRDPLPAPRTADLAALPTQGVA